MIVASIDLMNGKAVQLRQGREPVLERGDVEELAADFDRFGEVAVIDLDAALGKGDNGAILTRLLTLADCRVGGGIRTVEQALKWVSLGARKVIIGSQAFLDDTINHTFLGELRDAITPERVIIAIDARNGSIVTKGWRHDTGLNVLETVDALEPYAGEFLFTSVENEGMMAGTDIDLVKVLRSRSRRRITVAGGVSTLGEVGELARLGAAGLCKDMCIDICIDMFSGMSIDMSTDIFTAISTDIRTDISIVIWIDFVIERKEEDRG